MSCYSQTYTSPSVRPAGNSGQMSLGGFFRAIITMVDAFHEALEMRRVAYRRYRLSDE